MDPQQSTINTFTKYKKHLVIALAVFGGLFLGLVLLLMLSNARGLGITGLSKHNSYPQTAPGVSMGRGEAVMEEAGMVAYDGNDSYNPSYPTPIPQPTDYVPNLEQYETTDYTVTARLRDLDGACDVVESLKASDVVHFKYLSRSDNSCSANFFVEEEMADTVRDQMADIDGTEVSRMTRSVTRWREQLTTQSDIIREQLTSVEQTLTEAEVQYAAITEVARASNDASALTEAIRYKLEMIDTLNQRRINLTNQLQRLNQQAADLEERIGVVAFSVSFSRSISIDSEKTKRQWEVAWHELRVTVTTVLIGITTGLGIFALRAFQFIVYGLLLIVAARFLWKLVQKIWRR